MVYTPHAALDNFIREHCLFTQYSGRWSALNVPSTQAKGKGQVCRPTGRLTPKMLANTQTFSSAARLDFWGLVC